MGKGDLVVCVDAQPNKTEMDGLKSGAVYTLREVNRFCHTDGSNNGVWLQEIVRPSFRGVEIAYFAHRFRPVDENRLAIFREALAPAPRKRVRA